MQQNIDETHICVAGQTAIIETCAARRAQVFTNRINYPAKLERPARAGLIFWAQP